MSVFTARLEKSILDEAVDVAVAYTDSFIPLNELISELNATTNPIRKRNIGYAMDAIGALRLSNEDGSYTQEPAKYDPESANQYAVDVRTLANHKPVQTDTRLELPAVVGRKV